MNTKNTTITIFSDVNKHHSYSNFLRFLLKEKRSKRLLLIAFIASILQFFIFKLLYPYPDFFSDSYSYIYGAYANLDINIWPIGYSKFLRLFHFITHSDIALTAFQYILLELSASWFFFTYIYFYTPSKFTINVLFLFLFFNPLFLYICNYVNSDPLFASISLLWVTELIWIINRPRLVQLFTQSLLLFIAFTIRNNAYYYPIIAAIAFCISQHKSWIKLAGCVGGLVLIIPFIIHSRNEAYKITGTKQFSLFTGWQWANNALYIYDKINVDNSSLITQQARNLDVLSKSFFKQIPPNYRATLDDYVGNFFIRQPESPLKQYFMRYKVTDDYSQVVAWGKSSAVFETYGKQIIKNHPLEFFRYYIVLNSKNYFLPPLEKLELYNLGSNDVFPIAQDWFNLKTPLIYSASKNMQAYILSVFPLIFLFINLFFIGNITLLFLRKIHRSLSKSIYKLLLLLTALQLANFAFCVFATIIVFRYQFFPMIICLTATLLLTDTINAAAPQHKREDGQSVEEKLILNTNE